MSKGLNVDLFVIFTIFKAAMCDSSYHLETSIKVIRRAYNFATIVGFVDNTVAKVQRIDCINWFLLLREHTCILQYMSVCISVSIWITVETASMAGLLHFVLIPTNMISKYEWHDGISSRISIRDAQFIDMGQNHNRLIGQERVKERFKVTVHNQ